MYVLRCMRYVSGVCNPTLTVYYGQILVWFGINFIPQGTIELICGMILSQYGIVVSH